MPKPRKAQVSLEPPLLPLRFLKVLGVPLSIALRGALTPN